VNVNGCFWHQHPGCKRATKPQANAAWWSEKLTRNVERDSRNERELEKLGWNVFVIWECMTGSSDTWKALLDHLGAPARISRSMGGCDAG
jgi:DNA mismatch endonuclease (patch repair protein)